MGAARGPPRRGVQPPSQRSPRDHRAEAAAARRNKPTPWEVAGGPGTTLGAGTARAQAVLGRWVLRADPLGGVSSPPPNGHRATTAPRPRRPDATNPHLERSQEVLALLWEPEQRVRRRRWGDA
jgi:hypothetical protein